MRRGRTLRRVAFGSAAMLALLLLTVNLLSAQPGNAMFTDIATPALADGRARSEGACWADLDRDGDQDLFVANRGGASRLWRNDGSGRFTDIAGAAGVAGATRRATGCAFADLDNDGDPDLFLTVRSGRGSHPPANTLLRNNGDGTFSDVSNRANIALPNVGAASSDWADFDGDGDLDGFVAARQGRPDRINALFTQVAPLVFRNDAAQRGVADPPGRQTAFLGNWFDYDQDGDPDLLIAIDFWGAELYRNDGGRFSRVTTTALPSGGDKTPGAPPNNPMGVTWGDYDNDGCFDVWISGTNLPGQGGFEEEMLGDLASRLHRGDCRGRFTDATRAAGFRPTGVVEWSANFIDFDNDGDLDLSVVAGNAADKVSDRSTLPRRVITLAVGLLRRFIPYRAAAWAYRYEAMIPASGGTGVAAAMPNALYRNMLAETGTATFVDVTHRLGVGSMGATQGSAWADLDNDGDLDWFVPNRETPSRLFRNNGPVGHYLRVHLQGARIRDAIGAWVKIRTDRRWQIRHVHVLDGYLSQSQMDPHFGLGSATGVDELWVRWPGSAAWTLMCRGVPADGTVTISEGGGCRR